MRSVVNLSHELDQGCTLVRLRALWNFGLRAIGWPGDSTIYILFRANCNMNLQIIQHASVGRYLTSIHVMTCRYEHCRY